MCHGVLIDEHYAIVPTLFIVVLHFHDHFYKMTACLKEKYQIHLFKL